MIQPRRKSRAKRIIKWTALILVGLFIVLAAGTTFFVARSLPKTEGEIQVKGLTKKVEVVRDSFGVPHIEAENEHDLFFTQGYVQAQDRLFQMDLSRRQASGRLSEVIGDATVDSDKFFRTLGLRRAAEVSYQQYSERGKEVLTAFADGVNAYINELKENGKWPIEFTILGYKPEAWTPTDSLTIGKYMAFDLGGHWQDQAFLYYLLQTFPKEKAYDLFPSYPKDAPLIISKNDLNIENSFASAVLPHEFNGSNNWVISGKKSASGKPILADDPHLSLGTPSIWYQMNLKAPTANVSGVIFAGIPGIILGHNEKIAWGVTNTGPDVQDLFIEKRNPKQKDEFLFKEKWEKATVVKEPIKVKGKKAIDYEVTITRHGPIMSDFAGKSGKDTVLALQWTALQPSSELEAVLNMNKAENWTQFEKALEQFHTPAQNFVFAAQDGTIAYKANGKIPIRAKGDSLLPVPGWTGEYEWTDYIPYDKLPKTINPADGFVSTANNKVIDDSYPYHISHRWAQPYRQMRIHEVLKSKDQLTVKDMQALQMDQLDLQAKEFMPIFLKNLPAQLKKEEPEVIKLLENWDYVDSADLGAPLVFQKWMMKIREDLLTREIPEDTLKLFTNQKSAVDQLLRRAAEGKPGPWIQGNGGFERVLEKSLKSALKDIRELQGSNPNKWKWGEFHQVQFKHPLSSVSPLNYVFNYKGSIPAGGSSVTVQAAAFKDDGIINHGGSWRFVIDTKDLTKGYHLVGPGQSGHLFSSWYQNQMDDWVEGS